MESLMQFHAAFDKQCKPSSVFMYNGYLGDVVLWC